MTQIRRDSLLHLFATLGVIVVCVVGVGALQQPRLNEIREQSEMPTPEQLLREENATRFQLELLKQVPTFGFDRIISDWVFLDFLQYFGDTPAREQIGYGLSPDYFDVILKHDPFFRDAYLFLSASTTLYTGQPERTIELFERELPHLSAKTPEGAYFIWRYKAIDELLFLGDAAAAQQSFQMAAEWASTYNDPRSQAIARSSQQTANFLEENPDSLAAQISAWSMVYYNAFDENTQQLAVSRLEALGVDVAIDENGNLDISLPDNPSNSGADASGHSSPNSNPN